MDQHEIELLEKLAPTDPELKSLWEDHVLYEKQVEKVLAKSIESFEKHAADKEKVPKFSSNNRIRRLLSHRK